MTQENKELLFRDLCSKLPYGVKVKIKYYDDDWKLLAIYTNGTTYSTRDIGYPIETYFEDCKPYLFPLSSMTEAQKEELNRVTNGKFNSYGTYIDNCKPRNWNEWGTTEYNWIRHHDVDLLNTWLDKNYFDHRGLIEKGLAIDATNLNIY